MKRHRWIGAAAAALLVATPSPAQQPLLADDPVTQANGAAQTERDRPPGWFLAENRKLSRALSALAPQRKGVVDAYVISVALDSEPVFEREAREAGRVLARRYDAAGRTIVLAGGESPRGAPDTLAAALARVAEVMDPREDVLVLYATTHGSPIGVVYLDGSAGQGVISPAWLATTLDQLHIRNRLLLISACFAGIFVPPLASDSTVVISAASAEHTSFGCVSENDWTFFGDAMVNHALRKAQPIEAAFGEARGLVGGWEGQAHLIPSDPQARFGANVARWLKPLEARTPKAATAPVGRPAVAALDEAQANNH